MGERNIAYLTFVKFVIMEKIKNLKFSEDVNASVFY